MTETFDMNAPASALWLEHDIMTGDVIGEPTKSFQRLSDAVRFVMEELHPSMRHTAKITTDSVSLTSDEIEACYQRLSGKSATKSERG